MSRLYLFAVGGTGAKVMESVTMLMASGIFNDCEIIPVFFDFDTGDEHLYNSLQLINRYKTITANNSDIYYHDSERSFFSARFKSFTRYGYGRDTVVFPDCRNEIIRMNRYGTNGNTGLGHMLFSESRMADSSTFRELLSVIMPDDRIAITGSTFGGTSKAIIAELLSIIENEPALRQSEKAVILVEPHFTLSHGDIFDVENRRFYEVYRLFDSLEKMTYRIMTDTKTLELTHPRGMTYKNLSHHSELFAAFAIARFANRSLPYTDYNFKFESHDRPTLDSLIEISQNTDLISSENIIDLVAFAIAVYCIKKRNMPAQLHDVFTQRLNISETSLSDFENIITTFAECFIRWSDEMNIGSNGKFRLFDFNADRPSRIIADKKVTTLLRFFDLTYERIASDFKGFLIHSTQTRGSVLGLEQAIMASLYFSTHKAAELIIRH